MTTDRWVTALPKAKTYRQEGSFQKGRASGNWRGEVLILPTGEVAWDPVPTSLGGIAASRLTSSVCVCVRVELLSRV